PGVFSGSFNLISATNPPTAGKLRAQNGDTLTVQYTDASASNGVVRAQAAIDTIAPTISNVSADPDYEQATVSWTTSEPADSLVQFGESPILSRTAYNPALTTTHKVVVPNLLPSHLYYYQVTSRDAGGNATIKDSNGQPYTFTTLT